MTKLSSICEHLKKSQVPGMVCDGNRRILFINEPFLEMCGYEEDELLGQNPGSLLQGIDSNEETKASIRKKLQVAVPFDFSIINYRKDGSKFSAGIFVKPFVDGAESSDYFAGVGCELLKLESSPLATGPLAFRKAVAHILHLINE